MDGSAVVRARKGGRTEYRSRDVVYRGPRSRPITCARSSRDDSMYAGSSSSGANNFSEDLKKPLHCSAISTCCDAHGAALQVILDIFNTHTTLTAEQAASLVEAFPDVYEDITQQLQAVCDAVPSKVHKTGPLGWLLGRNKRPDSKHTAEKIGNLIQVMKDINPMLQILLTWQDKRPALALRAKLPARPYNVSSPFQVNSAPDSEMSEMEQLQKSLLRVRGLLGASQYKFHSLRSYSKLLEARLEWDLGEAPALGIKERLLDQMIQDKDEVLGRFAHHFKTFQKEESDTIKIMQTAARSMGKLGHDFKVLKRDYLQSKDKSAKRIAMMSKAPVDAVHAAIANENKELHEKLDRTAAEKGALKDDNAWLQAQIVGYERERTIYQWGSDQQAAMDKLRKANKVLTSDNKHLMSITTSSRREAEALAAKKEAVRAADAANREVSNKSKEIQKLKAAAEESAASLSKMSKECEVLRAQNQALQQLLQTVERVKAAELLDDNARLKAELEDTKGQLDYTRGQLGKEHGVCSRARNQLQTAHREINNLKDQQPVLSRLQVAVTEKDRVAVMAFKAKAAAEMKAAALEAQLGKVNKKSVEKIQAVRRN